MPRSLLTLACSLTLALAAACADKPTAGDSTPDTQPTDTSATDTAPDDPCADGDPGTDSDGDGLTDCQEIDCVSDPNDAEEQCYACGWPHGDPGTLESGGSQEGDVIKNLTLYDACLEPVKLWDFAGQYTLLVVTTGWCTTCWEGIAHAPEMVADFESANGIPLRYLVALYQDAQARAPDGQDAADYVEFLVSDHGLSDPGLAVLSEPTQTIVDAMPWEDALPGKCVLSPEMEMIHCYSGEDDAEALGKITEHAGL